MMTDMLLLADLDAEDAILGAMLMNPNAIDAVADALDATDFYRPGNATLYRTMVELRAEGIEVEPVTVRDRLRARDIEPEKCLEHLHALLESCPAAVAAPQYARIVRDRGRMERMRTAALEAADAIAKAADSDEAADVTERLMLTASRRRTRQTAIALSDALKNALTEIEERASGGASHAHISSGVGLIDSVGGLERKGLHILAARPGVGKTSLALQVAAWVAANVGPVLFASLEMGAAQLADRFIEQRCAIGRETLLSGRLSEKEIARLIDLIAAMERVTFDIDDGARLTVDAIRSRARRMHVRSPLALIVVDYVQIVHTPRRERNENREREVAQISGGLKQLAKELDCAVLALSQLNRDKEKRGEDSKARLSDLRDSGSLEQDADMVVFLNPSAADIKAHKTRISVEVDIAKHRNGPRADGRMEFNTINTSFHEVTS